MLSYPDSGTNTTSVSASTASVRSGRIGRPFTVPFVSGPKVTKATRPSWAFVRVRTRWLVD